MTSKPVEVQVPITEQRLVERKSKQMAIDDRPVPMSSPINNPAKFRPLVLKFISVLLKLTSFDKMA